MATLGLNVKYLKVTRGAHEAMDLLSLAFLGLTYKAQL